MLRKTLFAIALGIVALAFGASPSKAVPVEFFFGNNPTVPPPTGCTRSGSQPGVVCASSLTFNGASAGLGTLTATAYTGAPGSTAGFLTYKPENAGFMGIPANGAGESGLGESNSATTCTDAGPDCEIGGSASVAIQSNVALSELDVVIGSAQGGESFNVYTGSSLASLTLLTGSPFDPGVNITCPGDVCTINFAGATVVAIQNAGPGNVLLSAVSGPGPAVPEPASLAVLGAALVGFGVMRRRRR